MSTRILFSTRGLKNVLNQGLRAPLKLQTYRNLLYLLLMFPLGHIYLNFVLIGLFTGLGLTVVGIGLLIIVLLLALVSRLADFERTLIRVLLGVEIPASTKESQQGLWTQTKQLVTDLRTWTAVVYLLSVFIYGTIAFGLLAMLVVTVHSFLFAPLYYQEAPVVAYGPIPQRKLTFDILFGWDTLLVGLTTTFQLGSWQIETLPGAVFFAGLGLVLLLLTVQFVNGLASIWKRYAQLMLTVPRYWKLP
jgi:Putative sensor